jgi:flagellar biosynthesis/type III secretory pathway chaperone
MSVQPIISILEKIEKMQKSLLEHSYKKTELVKKNDMAELDQMLKIEQSHIAAIEMLEKQRQEVVSHYLRSKGRDISGIPTVGEVIEITENEEERKQLEELRKRLIQLVDELKNRNELNQKLIYSSLQFVNMSLEVLRPQPEQVNYSNKEVRGEQVLPKKSFFDSQA